MKRLSLILGVCPLVSLCVPALCAQTTAKAAPSLSGFVLDPSGAAIPHATLHLHSAAIDSETNSDDAGKFSLSAAPGTYQLIVSAQGFSTQVRNGFVLAPGRAVSLNVTLKIASEAEQIEVNSDSALSTEGAANKSALTFSGKQLDTFSDDPTVMQQELQAIGGSDPSNPPQIFVDGFSNGTMPPKESIREIRINQNPLSAQFDQFGGGRIEIFTKPGSTTLHGHAAFSIDDSALNATSPFAPVQPAYHSSYIDADINGPAGKHSSFYLSMTRNDSATNALVNATTLAGPLVQAIPAPTLSQSYSLRFDRQFGAKDTFIGRYTFNGSSVTNGGVGQFTLPSEAFNSDTHTQTLQLTDTHVFSGKIVSDSALQYIRTRSHQDALSSAPAVVVQGAFSSGGSPSQALHDNLDRLELREELSIAHGTHFIRTGGRYRLTRDANLATAGYNGQFTFSSLTAYQLTEQGIAAHQTDAQIRATCVTGTDGTTTCGGATQLSVAAGTPSASLLTGDLGLYAEDEWKTTPNLTLTYGLRVESQSAVPDHLDLGPRVAFAYSLKRDPKAKSPLLVFRGGFGIFYSRFASSNLLTSLRENGVSEQSYFLANPSSDIYNPNTATPPSTAGLSPSASTVYQIDPHLRSSQRLQGIFNVDRSLGKFGSVSVGYQQRRALHEFNSLNVNAPLPNGTRPLGGSQNVYQFASGGISSGHTISVNSNLNLTKTISMWEWAGITHQESDTQGATSFPSNSYNLRADAGPYGGGYSPRDLYMGINARTYKDVQLNLFVEVTGHSYFNITTGTDNNGDTIYNDRPAFATDLTRPSVVKTAFGNFDTAPIAGQTIIPMNYGNAPGEAFVGLNLNKSFRFGPRPAAPPAAAPPPPATASAPAAPSAKPAPKAELPPPRYRLQFMMNIENLFNHPNLAAPVGVLTSPQFGKSLALNSFFGSSNAANRTVSFRSQLSF